MHAAGKVMTKTVKSRTEKRKNIFNFFDLKVKSYMPQDDFYDGRQYVIYHIAPKVGDKAYSSFPIINAIKNRILNLFGFSS